MDVANGNDCAFASAVPQIAGGFLDIVYDGAGSAIVKPEGLERWNRHLLLPLVITQVALATASLRSLRRAGNTGVRASGWFVIGLATVVDLLAP